MLPKTLSGEGVFFALVEVGVVIIIIVASVEVVIVIVGDDPWLHVRVLVAGVVRGGRKGGNLRVAIARLGQQRIDERRVLRDAIGDELERRSQAGGDVLTNLTA